MARERVIVEIHTLDQAARVEDTVRTGYIDVIKDNLVHWIAVEEDLADSYGRLAQKHNNRGVVEGLKGMSEECRANLGTLRAYLTKFEELGQARARRGQLLSDMEDALETTAS
jgi:hypothetical protein